MVDLHCHDEFSLFDGFGKAEERAAHLKTIGHTSIATSNHGTLSGNVKTFLAAKKYGLKAILGVEAYFLPVKKEQTRGTHLCLYAKNLEGYGNLNRIMFAAEKQKFYNGIVDFEMLQKYKNGIICTSACVAGFLAQSVLKNNMSVARKFVSKMQEIFGDDFYIELQPYAISDEGVQELVNYELFKLAQDMGVKCILTSDSHRVKKEDLTTYLKLHEIKSHDIDKTEATYSERYVPTEKELIDRFVKMHGKNAQNQNTRIRGVYNDVSKGCYDFAKECIKNLEEIEVKVEDNYLDNLKLDLPSFGNENFDSDAVITQKVKEGLKAKGKLKPEYVARCKEELKIIKMHGFSDYFLIVQDYVLWAKKNDIMCGTGRGSVCNCLVAYALDITTVDSLLHKLDFRRFLREDKKKLPDVDLDFQKERRDEVIAYLCNKYEGKSARILSYGLYRVDNLINDLVKVCDVNDKSIITEIKSHCKSYIRDDESLNSEGLLSSSRVKMLNAEYDDIFTHFIALYKKVRYLGAHAAGVAVTNGNLLDYTSLLIKEDGVFCGYDLDDLEQLNVAKFDVLGLKTLESIYDLEQSTGVKVDYDTLIYDKKVLEAFGRGDCDGVFQFDRNTPRKILQQINADCFDDVVAANAMNRPGPLSLRMPELYAHNKQNIADVKNAQYYKYTQETYGTILYQEQLAQICINIGGLSWAQSDKIMKIMKGSESDARNQLRAMVENGEDDLQKIFIENAMKQGYTKDDAISLFDKMLVYSFNKGHSTGYSLISMAEMFYKVYHPTEYWFAKIKHSSDAGELAKFSEKAVEAGVVIFLPHVNYTAKTSLRVVDGEKVIQLGFDTIKGVGEKASEAIEREKRTNGLFVNFDNFFDRVQSRSVNSRVRSILLEHGALEFDHKKYINRVTKYNSALYSRAIR